MGSGTKIKTGILVSVTFAAYIIHVVFAALAGGGGSPKLFPTSVGNVSDNFKLLVTPASATFSIWSIIFFLQFFWMIYALVCLCRSGPATNLLSGKFYFAFLISTVFITIWLFSWSRKEIIQSLIFVVLHQVFVELAFGLACCNLREYLQTSDVDSRNRADVWAHRILVQNGILFYLTWTTVASLLNFAVALKEELGASDVGASLTILIILAIITVVWFGVENFAIRTYTEYTFAYYVAQIWALSGVICSVWGVNDTVAGFVLALLILTVILLIARIIIVAIRTRRRESYETITYDADTENVKSG